MKSDTINLIRHTVVCKNPLIHCITNPISITACANAILAVGGRPIMAEHPSEVGEITTTAHSLMLNLGNITDARISSMAISAAAAREENIPFVVDIVGAACSRLRRDYALALIDSSKPALIKGNYAEIHSLANRDYTSSGVDTDSSIAPSAMIETAAKLARQYDCTILASGKTDVITDGTKLILSYNGTPQLACITGTGCMLGALCTAFLSSADAFFAAACACTVLGISGELACSAKGNGSFAVNLIDALSTMSDEIIKINMKLEEHCLENF